jgi:lipopolysaccharide assembly outer membrane protein LptD (OstA)
LSQHFSHRCKVTVIAAAICLLGASSRSADTPLEINHSDQFEVLNTPQGLVYYLVGNVVLETETGFIYCDSATYRQGAKAKLKGRVVVDEADYRLTADSVAYDVARRFAWAWGDSVIVWTYKDSIYACGKYAEYDQNAELLHMSQRPTVLFGYPDTPNMLEVVADNIDYSSRSRIADAEGRVTMKSGEVRTESGCATADLDKNVLDLYDNPVAWRGKSRLEGRVIGVVLENRTVHRIDVIDSARGSFIEAVEEDTTLHDESKLAGDYMFLDFDNGKLAKVTCIGQAYSWYYPNPRGEKKQDENEVSGDTIIFFTESNVLKSVHVVGGAIGSFISRELADSADTNHIPKVDTVQYESSRIEYGLRDSLITLRKSAKVNSGNIGLESHKVELNTDTKIVKAWSAIVEGDSVQTRDELAQELQPNAIPVILHDGDEKVYGDYLEYSIGTKKGRIIQSKSHYTQGYYYGDRLVREQEKIFYVDDGRYTTCSADDPHFHFRSKSMKLMEGDKLIARPVVFYLGRLPLLAIPYYVFPLKRGRHSGILPLDFGSFQSGQRYVKNVGYYWAASDYFDWQGGFDYYERQRTFTISNRLNYVQRYVLSVNASAGYTRETSYDRFAAAEKGSSSWIARGVYQHSISPSFTISADGQYQSNANYFKDYSSNLDERLNRSVKSSANFTKRFGRSVVLSGSASHTENLDAKSRTDNIPEARVTLPSLYPFGSGSRDANGQVVTKWYHGFTFRYSPNILNFSTRTTLRDTTFSPVKETPTRKKYARINHNPSLTLPVIKPIQWITIVPSFSYNESWTKIFRTDQSDRDSIDADPIYRTYSYSTGASVKTSLYGGLTPNFAGLVALRHVLTPSVSYGYSPDIDRLAKVRSYASAIGGSKKSSTFTFLLEQLFQAKVRKGEEEQNVNLLTINSSFGYNTLADSIKFSNVTTSMSSTLRSITLSSSMVHSLYKPRTAELNWRSPDMLSFDFSASTSFSGSGFIFDEKRSQQVSTDTASGGASAPGPRPWRLGLEYAYSESGRGSVYQKSIHFISAQLHFALTPSTTVSLGQRYNFLTGKTIHNAISIQKKIHCWSGSLYWVPTGSNRGFGFKLFVTDIPSVKVDNNYSGFLDGVGRY